MKQSIYCLFLMCFFTFGETQTLSGLSDAVLQDIFNIYNKIPVTTNTLLNHTVTADNIHYYYFNSSNPETYTMIGLNNSSIVSKTAPIVILIHGWTQDRTAQWYEDIKTALFKNNSAYVVIEIDYSVYAGEDYYNAQNDAQYVGVIIGQFVVTLVNNYSVPLDNFLIIGHSLGGQVASFVGKTVYKLLNEKLPRIIAPDPAGPLYQAYPTTQRLCPTDAKIVHVIHSNGGEFGFLGDCGTIDFYPNGGSLQPGCIQSIISNITQITNTAFCDHHRSWQYLIEAISTQAVTFLSQKCPTYANYVTESLLHLCQNDFEQLGSLTTTKTGDYFCNTSSSSPYSK